MSSYWETAVNTVDGPVLKSGPLQKWDVEPESEEEGTSCLPEASIFTSEEFPCGRHIQNRLVKVAMYEHLGSLGGSLPNEHHYSLYSKWGKHNWGMIITGNVQVSPSHLSLGRDLIVPEVLSKDCIKQYKKLASCIQGGDGGSMALMQLCHAGRQSANFLGGRKLFVPPLAPSPVPLGTQNGISSKLFHALMFQSPREMTLDDIDKTVTEFVRGAVLALEAEFDGIELHAAHGYLLSQFLNSKTNTRTDEYSAKTPENSLRFLRRIVEGIRDVVPEDFVIGIKLNAADYVDREEPQDESAISASESRALEHIALITGWRAIDFFEISGGDYENPEFMSTEPISTTSPRQAFYSRMSQKVMHAVRGIDVPMDRNPARHSRTYPNPLVLLTGGLRTPGHLDAALRSGHADLCGIGRGSVLCPELPDILEGLKDRDTFAREPNLDVGGGSWFWDLVPKIRLVGAGMGMAWYLVAIRRLSTLPDEDPIEREATNLKLGGIGGIIGMWAWRGPSPRSGRLLFSLVGTVVVAVGATFVAYR